MYEEGGYIWLAIIKRIFEMPQVYIFAFIFIFLDIARSGMAETCSIYWQKKYIVVFNGVN
jgi:hypothetical protein